MIEKPIKNQSKILIYQQKIIEFPLVFEGFSKPFSESESWPLPFHLARSVFLCPSWFRQRRLHSSAPREGRGIIIA